MKLLVKKLVDTAVIPTNAYDGDAGWDLYSSINVIIEPGQNKLIDTGIAVGLYNGWVGFVCSRSGLASKSRIFVLNAPGIVDAGYRGEIKVNLMNASDQPFKVEYGMKIAQLLIQQVEPVTLVESDTLDSTDRGQNGHGSTG